MQIDYNTIAHELAEITLESLHCDAEIELSVELNVIAALTEVLQQLAA